LLGIDDIEDAAPDFKEVELFIHRLAEELVPSLVGLLGGFRELFHDALLIMMRVVWREAFLTGYHLPKTVVCQEAHGHMM
jgi:hypothetical protein